MTFVSPANPLPSDLIQLGTSRLQQLISSHPDYAWLREYQDSVVSAFALSDFIFEHCSTKPHWLTNLLKNSQLHDSQLDVSAELMGSLADVSSEHQLHAQVRQFRNYHMLRIAWRDLLNLQPISDSLRQVSELAVSLINHVNDWLYHSMQERFGIPLGPNGNQPMLIMGMGKLGGLELNFSSDIDLIFSYPEQGETQGGRKSIEHQQFFTKLAQKLIAALNQITADGQVFRVDMRLRPFGDSGPLVMHFDAMEDYYQEQGRDWERYAMLKGKILNPACHYSAQLANILKPFVYRRYLDFSAIESLRTMKLMIQQEVRRRGLVHNIKLGQGGIREAEFIVQSMQLINGGREPRLQVQSLQVAINTMAELDILPVETVSKLLTAYLWLRKTEHCLQQFADKQTQDLPDNALDQTRLAHVLGCENYVEFNHILARHLDTIHQQFLLLVRDEENPNRAAPPIDPTIIDLWHLTLPPAEVASLYTHLCQTRGIAFPNFEHSDPFYLALSSIKDSLHTKRVGQRGLSIINQLMPCVLDLIWCNQCNQPWEIQNRVLKVFKSILGRTAYLQLLWENQGALKHLIKLCEASPWVTEQISRFPLLLDELLHPANLYLPLTKAQYSDELRQLFLRIEPEDLELQIESLRQFKLTQQLKVSASDISQAISIMKVSDYLTFLAEALIHQVVEFAWQQMTAKYGNPVCQRTGTKSFEDKGFGVVGYGKTGGWELGYGSDLDLVFLHDCDGNELTTGPKQVESSYFYIKLAQRILHIFTIKTGLGWLYEVDMRLRPSGNAGLLVCHINGYREYQMSNAWTWEHQALCRARFIEGNTDLQARFNQTRHDILSQERDKATLSQEVVDMRKKMREHLAKGNADYFDLKQDAGGVADIEFIVQFMLLAHCHAHPTLTKWTDNVRVLEALNEAALLTHEEATQLTQAYLVYRNLSHKLTLQNESLAPFTTELRQHQEHVQTIWQKYLT